MPDRTHIYGAVDSQADWKDVFLDIRRDVEEAKSRSGLTELYKRAGYLITLTHAPSWVKKFGREAATLRQAAEEQFAITARKINRRAKDIGAEPDYDEKWG